MSVSFSSAEPLFFIDGYPFFSRRKTKKVERKPLTRRLYWSRVRKIHSKGAIIVLIWVSLVWTSVVFVGEFADTLRLQAVGNKILKKDDIDLILLGREIPIHYAYYATIGAIWLLGTPVIGWLADIRFGRYRVMQVSLWVIWCAVIAHSCLYIAHNHDKKSQSLSTVDSVTSFITLAVYMCGLVGFLINSVQFGMDQMPDASSPELSAFIHWYVFAMSAGIWFAEAVLGFLKSCSPAAHDEEDRLSPAEMAVLAILPTFLTSLVLLTDSFFRHHLIMEPHSKNPLALVTGVLKYVAKHNKPTNPSAYVYTLRTIPSRFDYAKTQFGGPYTTEQVEDVKTFLRILLLMSPAILILASSLLTVLNLGEFKDHLKRSSEINQCGQTLISFFGYDYRFLPMWFIVINEFLIHPVFVSFYSFCCKTLRRITIGTLLGLALSLVLMCLEIVGHELQHSTKVPCLFLVLNSSAQHYSDSNTTLPIDYLPVAIPTNFILALQIVLFITGAWEFICAQAPYSMRGLLIGAVWATLAIAAALVNAISLGWYFGWNRHPPPTNSTVIGKVGCGGFYFLSVFLLGLVGLVLFCGAVCWYRPRKREEEEDHQQQQLLEEIFDKEFDAARAVNTNVADTDRYLYADEDDSNAMLGETCTVTNSSIQ